MAKRHWSRNLRQEALLSKYGLTETEYDSLKLAQDNKCYICGNETKALGLDHNHTTGKIRKFLCGRCNYLVAVYEDKTVLYENIKWYVFEHR